MRIVGRIQHPSLNISIFSWNEKYIVQVEAGLFSQSYKFRQDDFQNVDDLRKFFDENLLADIMKTFQKMSFDASSAAKRLQKRDGVA